MLNNSTTADHQLQTNNQPEPFNYTSVCDSATSFKYETVGEMFHWLVQYTDNLDVLSSTKVSRLSGLLRNRPLN